MVYSSLHLIISLHPTLTTAPKRPVPPVLSSPSSPVSPRTCTSSSLLFSRKEKFACSPPLSKKTAWLFVVVLAAAKDRKRRFRKKRRPQAFSSSNSKVNRSLQPSKDQTTLEDITTRANTTYQYHLMLFSPRLYYFMASIYHMYLRDSIKPIITRRLYYFYGIFDVTQPIHVSLPY